MDEINRPLEKAGQTDIVLLFASRCVRLFAYGFLSVVLVLYLKSLGLTDASIGLLLTLTLLGDAFISLGLTSWADRIGRRRMLIAGSTLMLFAALLFSVTGEFHWLVVAATIGVISPSGNEVGPFLSIEQAALTQLLPNENRTMAFAWYNLVGSVATAFGALVGGWSCEFARRGGAIGPDIYRPVILGYGAFGLILALMFFGLSSATEAATATSKTSDKPGWFGLGKSARIVAKLSMLFSLDAFGGGFVVQSVLAYWFYLRFGLHEARLGEIFFGANLLAAVSSLLAAWTARRIGLINTMVFTHLPSNILLILVPLMPDCTLAVTLLWIRFSISQMDVPTRQSYVMAVVAPEERSAASGVTAMSRSFGAAISPLIAATLIASPHTANWIFYLSGGLKIVYDLLLYRAFVTVKPPEEH